MLFNKSDFTNPLASGLKASGLPPFQLSYQPTKGARKRVAECPKFLVFNIEFYFSVLQKECRAADMEKAGGMRGTSVLIF